MKTNAYLGLMLVLGLAACGGSDGGKEEDENSAGNGNSIQAGATVDVDGDGASDGVALDVDGDGTAESIDRDGDKKPDGPLPASSTVVGGGSTGNMASGSSGGGSTGTTGNTPISGGEDDGGAASGGSTGTVVVMTKATVLCGSQEAEIDVGNNYACCDSLSGGKWATPTVKAACNKYTAPFGQEPTDAVGSECDGRDDCGSSYCCFVYNPMGPPVGATGGRAHGRKCTTEASCNDTTGFATGVSATFSCRTDSDCPQKRKCVAEPMGLTSGNKPGRAWVKVCQ